jgi:glucose-6-phosphate isomerase
MFTQDLEGFPSLPPVPQTLAYLHTLEASLPLFQQLQSDDFIDDIAPVASHFQAFEDILILGTGGSSLGGQALLCLKDPQSLSPRLHFLDNIDPHTFDRLLPTLNLQKTGIIAISKSGNTAETLMQLLTCLPLWLSAFPQSTLKDNIVIVSEPRDNAIRRLAAIHGLPCLDHPADIGGRFAVFTVVGMLPALIAGIDGKAVRQGAREILKRTLTGSNCPALLGAVAHKVLSTMGITQTVLMPYCDRLVMFTLWFRQLFAESIGKNGKGITPIQALGTVDQHSQLQLYLDGPRDKVFTIITLDYLSGENPQVTLPPGLTHPALDLFQGKTMGSLMAAEQKAVIDTLCRHSYPTRVIHLSTLDAKTLGGLMMHFILETLALAHLLDVNPFNQPAVEEGKILTQQYLRSVA